MEFWKLHGLGNDYLLIDARSAPERDWSILAHTMCDRHFGAGADGLLLVLPSSVAHFRMRMFNPDGSEAEMCGNGIRCLAKYVFDRGLHPHSELTIETLSGVKELHIIARDGRAEQIRVNMGAPELRPAHIPVVASQTPVIDLPLTADGRELRVTCVSMGNPHAVAFLNEDPDRFPLEVVGPLVEHHSLFPRRVNFEVCRMLSRSQAKARVWERGAGITLACGTGACAVMVAARLKGLADDRLRLALPGGVLDLEWDGQSEVLMTGPAALVFRGEWLE